MSPCRNILGRGFIVHEVQPQHLVRCERSFNLDENFLWAQGHFDQSMIAFSL